MPCCRRCGIGLEICRSFDELIRELTAGAGAILLPEEALSPAHTAALRAVLAAQPPWSDLPVLVLTRPGADSVESNEAAQQLGNVTLLERPVRLATLLTAVRTALRARTRQYQIREHLADRARSEESLRLADRRKDEFLATLGHELRNPLAPLLNAVHMLKTVEQPGPGGHPGPPGDGATAQPPAAARRRSAGGVADHPRPRRGAPRADRSRLRDPFGDRHQPSSDRHGRPPADRRSPGRADCRLRRHRPAHPGLRQPAQQRGQVHQRRRPHPDRAPQGREPRRRFGARQRHRHCPRSTRVGVRDVHAGRSLQSPGAGRAGHRPDAGPQPGRDARRHRGGAQRRPGHRQRVRRRAPGAAAPMCRPTAMPRGRRPFPAGASWSSTTTATPPTRLASCSSALGATVSIAHSGRAALETFSSFAPDTVLLDIGMPEMDGYEVARRIRAVPAHRDVLLIALDRVGPGARSAAIARRRVRPSRGQAAGRRRGCASFLATVETGEA